LKNTLRLLELASYITKRAEASKYSLFFGNILPDITDMIQ